MKVMRRYQCLTNYELDQFVNILSYRRHYIHIIHVYCKLLHIYRIGLIATGNFYTSFLRSELASFCTAGVSREDPLSTLLREARLEWTVWTSLMAL